MELLKTYSIKGKKMFGKSGPDVKKLDDGVKVVVYNLGKARIHSYITPEESFGDATHIIETENFLVLIDSQFMTKYAKGFREYADSIGKTIAGIIISHAHPDHYFGLADYFGDITSYAFPEVRKDITEKGQVMLDSIRKNMGDAVPKKIKVPDENLHTGSVTIDGLKYIYTKYKSAEADVQTVLELPDLGVMIVQDLVYNNYHPWLSSVTFDNWLQILEELKAKKYSLIMVGHGMPTSNTYFDSMIRYLNNAAIILQGRKKGSEERIKEKLVELYPHRQGAKIIDMYLEDLL